MRKLELYTRRYLTYINNVLRTNNPEIALEADRRRFPGGSMYGFMSWVDANARYFARKLWGDGLGREEVNLCVRIYQRQFDEYLEAVSES